MLHVYMSVHLLLDEQSTVLGGHTTYQQQQQNY